MTTPITDKYGWFNVHDSNYLVPQVYTALGANWDKISDDGAGPLSNSAHKPTSITKVWDTTTSQLDFNDLTAGDSFEIRVDLDITTSSANQEVDIRGEFAIGASPYTVSFYHNTFKSSGVHQIMVYIGGPISSETTRVNPGEIQIYSNADLTYLNQMMYFNVRRK